MLGVKPWLAPLSVLARGLLAGNPAQAQDPLVTGGAVDLAAIAGVRLVSIANYGFEAQLALSVSDLSGNLAADQLALNP